MQTFIRAHVGSYAFAALQSHISADGGDGMEDEGGVCACDSVTSLLHNTVMSALEPTDEVIVFKGYPICEIYDGYRVRPVTEIARFTVADLATKFDEIDELMYV